MCIQDLGEVWDRVRNCVTHEDQLVNQRITWMFTVEGLVLGAFFVFQSSSIAASGTLQATVLQFLVFILMGLAAWCCLTINLSCKIAFKHLGDIADWWETNNPRENWGDEEAEDRSSTQRSNFYPPVRGKFKSNRWLNYHNIPLAVAILNGILAVVAFSMVIAFSRGYKAGPQAEVQYKHELGGTSISTSIQLPKSEVAVGNVSSGVHPESIWELILEDIKSNLKARQKPAGASSKNPPNGKSPPADKKKNTIVPATN